MADRQEVVKIELTRDEAYEILMRCFQSEEPDTIDFASAIQKLGRAIERPHAEQRRAA